MPGARIGPAPSPRRDIHGRRSCAMGSSGRGDTAEDSSFLHFPPLVRFLRPDGEELFSEVSPTSCASPAALPAWMGTLSLRGDFRPSRTSVFTGWVSTSTGCLTKKERSLNWSSATPKSVCLSALKPRLRLPVEHARHGPSGAGRERHQVGGRWRPADRLLGHTGATPAEIVSQYAKATGLAADATRVGGRLLAVQAALPDPGRAAGGGPGAQAAGFAFVGHRDRLLPLDPPGRVEVRPAPSGPTRKPWSTNCESLGVELMVSVWPSVNPAVENYSEMDRVGCLIGNVRACRSTCRSGTRAAMARSSCASTTRPTPRLAATSGKSQEGYGRYGIRAFWLDACEPEMLPEDPESDLFYLRPRGRGAQRLPPRARSWFRRRALGQRGRGDPDPLPVRLGREPAVRRGGLVRRHRLDLRGARRADPAGLNIGIAGSRGGRLTSVGSTAGTRARPTSGSWSCGGSSSPCSARSSGCTAYVNRTRGGSAADRRAK